MTIHAEILDKLVQLGAAADQYSSIIRAYVTCRLIEAYRCGSSPEEITQSEQLRRLLTKFSIPCPDAKTSPMFFVLCSLLRQTDLLNNHIAFFGCFAPGMVANWDIVEAYTPKNSLGTMLLAIADLLDLFCTGSDISLNPQALSQFYQTWGSRLHLTEHQCTELCSGILLTPLKDVQCTPCVPIAQLMELCHQKMISKNVLIQEYANRLAGCAPNTPLGGRRSSHSPMPERGQTLSEQQFNNAVDVLLNEKPTDIIRTLFYGSNQSDSSFEVSFVLHECFRNHADGHRFVIVNPSPDFLLQCAQEALSHFCPTFVVPDSAMATIYRHQFSTFRFHAMNEVPSIQDQYDTLVIFARQQALESFSDILSLASPTASLLWLLPESWLKRNKLSHHLSGMGFHMKKIISIPSSVIHTTPKKKLFLYAEKRNPLMTPVIQLLFGKSDDNAACFYTLKSYYSVEESEFAGTRTLAEIRKSMDRRSAPAVTRHPNQPEVFRFSKEIVIHYTIRRTDSHGGLSGKAYYRAILRPDDKSRRKHGKRLTEIIEKGLRGTCKEQILSGLEQIAFDPRLCDIIVSDVLDFYGHDLSNVSLKTIWFCCRHHLSRRYGYREDIAQSLFVLIASRISDLHLSNTLNLDIDDALSEMFPDKSKHQKYWNLINLILKIACQESFIAENPLDGKLQAQFEQIRRLQQEVRNAFVKKTFSKAEEIEIISFLQTHSGEGGVIVPRVFHDGLWLAVMLRFLTAISTRELCALRWHHVKSVPALGFHQLIVTQHVQDSGQIKTYLQNDPIRHRIIPLVTIAADALLHWKAFVMEHFHISEDEISTWPIILGGMDKPPGLQQPFCDPSDIQKQCKKLIEHIAIKPHLLALPDRDGSENETDINRYYGDLFYTHFLHRAKQLCLLTEGEYSYILGKRPSSTFDIHYCDFGHDLIQHQILRKLMRWTGSLIPATPSAPQIISGTMTQSTRICTTASPALLSAMDISLSSKALTPMSGLQLTIESDYGVKGKIVTQTGGNKI